MSNPLASLRVLVLPSATLFLLATAPLPATAHHAKSGWAYPIECCSNKDCREISAESISERPDGYVIANTGERVGHADPRLRDSPDGVYHWCSADGAEDTRTICLFVPPQSF
jgi:hypothetical protein